MDRREKARLRAGRERAGSHSFKDTRRSGTDPLAATSGAKPMTDAPPSRDELPGWWERKLLDIAALRAAQARIAELEGAISAALTNPSCPYELKAGLRTALAGPKEE